MKKPGKKTARSETLRKLPSFKTEEAERTFWARADSTEYINWQEATRPAFPKLKPSLRTISIRLPVSMIEELKSLANSRDVPYQSLLKVYLAQRLAEERRKVVA